MSSPGCHRRCQQAWATKEAADSTNGCAVRVLATKAKCSGTGNVTRSPKWHKAVVRQSDGGNRMALRYANIEYSCVCIYYNMYPHALTTAVTFLKSTGQRPVRQSSRPKRCPAHAKQSFDTIPHSDPMDSVGVHARAVWRRKTTRCVAAAARAVVMSHDSPLVGGPKLPTWHCQPLVSCQPLSTQLNPACVHNSKHNNDTS